MRDVEADVASALRSHLNVMITGEYGMGRRSMAHWIETRSRRAAGRSVTGRSPGALDSVDGLSRALTDAMPDGTFHVEGAERMSLALQLRLLGFIKQQTSGPATNTDVRFITVSSTNLFDLVRCDAFCGPLFYRLNGIHVIIPPLRDHPEDIPVLLRHFLSLPAHAPVRCLSRKAWERLLTYEWPGNVQELQAAIEELKSRGLDRLIDLNDLPPGLAPVGSARTSRT
jgi:DNA-binding NtrC family response regulator